MHRDIRQAENVNIMHTRSKEAENEGNNKFILYEVCIMTLDQLS